MIRRAAAVLLFLGGASLIAEAFEPRARPLRQRLLPAEERQTPRRPPPVDPAVSPRQRSSEPRSAALSVRAQLLFANSRYEAWVLGGQADTALFEQVVTTLRRVRAVKPDLVLDERFVPPKLIALWNETR